MSDPESETSSFLQCPCPACAIDGMVSFISWGWGSSAAKHQPKHQPRHHINSDAAGTPKTPIHEPVKSSIDIKKPVLNLDTGASTQDSAKPFTKGTPRKQSKPSTNTPAQPTGTLNPRSIKNSSNSVVLPVALTKDPIESVPKHIPSITVVSVVPTRGSVSSAPNRKEDLKHNPEIAVAPAISTKPPVRLTPKDTLKHNPDVTTTSIVNTQSSAKFPPEDVPKHNPSIAVASITLPVNSKDVITKHTLDVAVVPITPTQASIKETLNETTSSTKHSSGPGTPHTQNPNRPTPGGPNSTQELACDSGTGAPINHTQDPQIKTIMVNPLDPIIKPTEEECLARLATHIKREKADLVSGFFKDGLTDYGEKATKMVASLIDNEGCRKREIAMDLSILTLYDLVIFIDDSPSMGSDANSKILTDTLTEICKIYSLANETGIKAVRYLNHRRGKGNVKAGDVLEVVKRCAHTGLTRIGTELHRRILNDLVLKPKVEMSKPLLVMIVTDGTVEGESETLLPKVIVNCVATLKKDGRSHQSVAFQFCRIGNDPEAIKFLKDLDNHPKLGDHIDCLTEHFHLENIADAAKWDGERWNVMCKLLLGPLIPHWDDYDKPMDEDNLEGDGELDNRDDDEEYIDD